MPRNVEYEYVDESESVDEVIEQGDELFNILKHFQDNYGRLYLDCDYDEKYLVKRAGGKWDAKKQRWYIPNNIYTYKPFERYIPTRVICLGRDKLIEDKLSDVLIPDLAKYIMENVMDDFCGGCYEWSVKRRSVYYYECHAVCYKYHRTDD